MLLLALLFAGQGLVYPTMTALWDTWHRESRLEREIRTLEKENARLEETINELGPQGSEIERLSREELNWAKPGEFVIKVPEKK